MKGPSSDDGFDSEEGKIYPGRRKGIDEKMKKMKRI